MIKKILEYITNSWYYLINNKDRRSGRMEERKINRSIIDNSYYLISLFIDGEAEITNLKLQKLMYFVEAYYMAKNDDENELFNSKWSAWDYGPVNIDLYNYYKKFGSLPILLTEEEKNIGENLSQFNKDYIDKIYDDFGDLSAFKLVTLTHLKGSPWYEIYEKNQKNKKYDFDKINSSEISKIETKVWIKEQFSFMFEGDK